MQKIELERYGRIVAGEYESYFLMVHYDAEKTNGYYIFFVDNIENASDGGDYWEKDMEGVRKTFRLSGWEVEWLPAA